MTRARVSGDADTGTIFHLMKGESFLPIYRDGPSRGTIATVSKGRTAAAMWDRHPVRLALLHMLPQVAQAHGLSLPAMLAQAGIKAEDTLPIGRVVARAQICSVLQNLARRSDNPAIGLDLATSADPAELGPTGQALFAGGTLGECLVAHVRHMPSLQGGIAYGLRLRGDRAVMHHRLADSDTDHAAVLNEGVAGFLLGAIRGIVGDARADIHVTLPHRARVTMARYEDKLQTPVSFAPGAELTLSFDAALLDRRNVAIGAAGIIRDDVSLPAGPGPLDDDALVGILLSLFEAVVLVRPPTLLDTSQTLGISPRSLQRRLAARGTSFEALLDQWRQGRARHYLAESPLPVGSVARALGYSDPAHFVRAFRRWEGLTPMAWRQMAIARTGGSSLSQREA